MLERRGSLIKYDSKYELNAVCVLVKIWERILSGFLVVLQCGNTVHLNKTTTDFKGVVDVFSSWDLLYVK